MMLLAEGKDRLREEVQRLRAMQGSGASLSLSVDLSMMVARSQDDCSTVRRQCPVQLDLLPMPTFPSAAAAPHPPTQQSQSQSHNPFPWKPLFNRSRSNSASGNEDIEAAETYSSGHGGSPRGIDVNQIPSSADCDDVVVSSPNSINLKREREKTHDFDLERDRTCDISSRGSDEEEGGTTRKKLRLSKEQSALLEESFKEHSTLNPKQKNALAKQLNLRPRQVEVWFQNRRARTKLKQTEVDCELLKRCCETLTEENRRLQKELQELRALKVAPPCVIAHDFYMPLPAATLTMCPSCERVTTMDNKTLAFAKPGFSHYSQSSAAC
ncbi:homeobox-leucine zipper protein [Marchantia polymorpha subsp. ruderalis]|nr:hypothetical protein MARPO_0069s0069 [Marchantia polymorpha]BBN03526.1 hypothetical protein Mp_2g24200 [Marchantia polymorpha subsp. ruderalis]|eukprot:PTQ35732.1 hypothetical protein MARPO_0069s0069 [Marchantia polymorpha]